MARDWESLPTLALLPPMMFILSMRHYGPIRLFGSIFFLHLAEFPRHSALATTYAFLFPSWRYTVPLFSFGLAMDLLASRGLPFLWDAFWRAPSRSLLNDMLAMPDAQWREAASDQPWDGPPIPGGVPRLCASAGATLAVADHRKKHRPENPSTRERFGLDSLGEPAAASRREPGHEAVLSWGIAIWDRLLGAGHAVSPDQALLCADVLFCHDLWEQPEWHQDIQSIGSEGGRVSAATPLMRRVFDAAARLDPTLGMGSSMVEQFLSTANGRNRYMAKLAMIMSREVSPLWDPMWSLAPGAAPLWKTMMRAPSRLGASATGLLMHRIGEMQGSPFESDQALAEAVVGTLLSLGRKNQLAPSPKRARGWHARSIAERWAGVEGARFGHAKNGAPDWFWLACSNLYPFDAEPPVHAISMRRNPNDSGTLSERDGTFGAFELLDRLGCDPAWTGPDGLSALDKMKVLRGYEAWVARFERRLLSEAAGEPTLGAPDPRRL